MTGQDEIPDELKNQIGKFCDQQRDGLTEIVRTIIAQQIETAPPVDAEAAEERRKLDRIKLKDYCSPAEAAMLFGCSAQHLRNLVDKAIKGISIDPIPYCDLDGVTTFPVRELLEWAHKPKQRTKTTRPGNAATESKSHLKIAGAGK